MSAINFKNQSLVIGYAQAFNGIDEIDKSLALLGQIHHFFINIKLNGTNETPIWTVAIVAPKINRVNNVELKIKPMHIAD